MPGQTPYEATEAFLAPIRSALGCVARAKIVTSPGGMQVLDASHAWTINEDRGADLGQGLVLTATMNYRIIRDDRPDHGPLRVTTERYMYHLSDGAHEQWALHWHPLGNSSEGRPHQHFGARVLRSDARITPKSHLVGARASFEQAVRWAIEFGATPLVDDWEDRLTLAESPFKLYRSWHVQPEEAKPREAAD